MKHFESIAVTTANLITNVPVSATAPYDPAKTYPLGEFVRVPETGQLFSSVKAANTGHPLTDTTWWNPEGYENRFSMFDRKVGSQTKNPGSIVVRITPNKVTNKVIILNMSGAVKVQTVMVDPVEGEVFNHTKILVQPSGNSHWNWHFLPVERDTRYVSPDLPAFARAYIEVTITGSDALGVGLMGLGFARLLGGTKKGMTFSLNDYSTRTKDKQGSYEVIEGPYSDTGRYQVLCENELFDRMKEYLAKYRARPCFWMGDDDLKGSVVFGFLEKVEVIYSGSFYTDVNVEVQGLT